MQHTVLCRVMFSGQHSVDSIGCNGAENSCYRPMSYSCEDAVEAHPFCVCAVSINTECCLSSEPIFATIHVAHSIA